MENTEAPKEVRKKKKKVGTKKTGKKKGSRKSKKKKGGIDINSLSGWIWSALIVLVVCLLVGGYAGFNLWKVSQKEDSQKTKVAGKKNEPPAWPRKDQQEGKPFSVDFDGVDISRFQGRVRWEEVSKAEVKPKFVYARAIGTGGKVDSEYLLNMEEGKKLGIKMGSYLVFTMGMSVDAQIDSFCKVVDMEKQDLLPVIDIEMGSLADGDNVGLKDSVMRLAQIMDFKYARPIIYSNYHFYITRLSPELNEYPLWIARYGKEPKIEGTDILMWQFTDKGHVRGFWIPTDLNRFVNGFGMDNIEWKK